jgi:hypothetical protein
MLIITSYYDINNIIFIYILFDLIRHGDFLKKIAPHLVSLIMVEGLFSPYIVTHFDMHR